MTEPKVLIVSGGLSHERDVSLRSGRRVADALREAGVQVRICDLDADFIARAVGGTGPSGQTYAKPDLVWPLLHGPIGEDGSLRDVLDLLGVPYLGSGAQASRAAWDKAVAKTLVSRAGLATPDHFAVPQELFRQLGADALMRVVLDKFGLPLVVKPLMGGSALGVSVVSEEARLGQALMECFSYGDVALLERAVSGTELAVSVVDTGDGPVALPAVEIVTEGAYDFDARYNPGRAQFFAPARLSDEVAAAAAEVAVRAHETLGLVRISRTDVIVSEDGTVWFLEANVAPGMQETSLLPQAAEAGGYKLPELYRALVEASL
jgi:D-alanine-D-alanine ligase